MTISLSTTGRRFNSLMTRLDGMPFSGVLMPMDEAQPASYDFSEPRQVLRVDVDCPVGTKDLITDPAGRIFLLADHDTASATDQLLYRSHRAYAMNKQVAWKRPSTVIDTLTGLPKGSGMQDLGMVWILAEQFGRLTNDPGTHTRTETTRAIVGADVLLGDTLEGLNIRRIDDTLGVWLVEME